MLDLATTNDDDYTTNNEVNSHEGIDEDLDSCSDDDTYQDESYNILQDESSDDEDCELEFRNLMDNHNVFFKKRKLEVPCQLIYNKDTFISKVDIEMLLSLGQVHSFDLVNQRRTSRSRRVFSGQNNREDVRAKAIHMANSHIQNGDLQVLKSTQDNPILECSSSHIVDMENFDFTQGWGRRTTRDSSVSMYGEKYLEIYKQILIGFFNEGKKDRFPDPGTDKTTTFDKKQKKFDCLSGNKLKIQGKKCPICKEWNKYKSELLMKKYKSI